MSQCKLYDKWSVGNLRKKTLINWNIYSSSLHFIFTFVSFKKMHQEKDIMSSIINPKINQVDYTKSYNKLWKSTFGLDIKLTLLLLILIRVIHFELKCQILSISNSQRLIHLCIDNNLLFNSHHWKYFIIK